jgi:hypothetical protein
MPLARQLRLSEPGGRGSLPGSRLATGVAACDAPPMRRLFLGCVVAASLGANATASIWAGHITALRARFYTSHVHYGVRYKGYANPAVDVRIYRTRGSHHRIVDHHKTIRRTWQKVSADDMTGVNGLAVFDIYYEDLHACAGTASRTNYVAVFRLFNPTTDSAVDYFRYSFYVRCR